MTEQNPQEKLLNDVKHFLEVYKVLSPDGKAQFEGQMAGSVYAIKMFIDNEDYI
ncbi:MAG: hypothetical protein U9R38_06010 [Candidatus Margulisiibacteriota bacterium]|nr:hypothetical protein [Candidatus Margulisiibacteriota bacterium]